MRSTSPRRCRISDFPSVRRLRAVIDASLEVLTHVRQRIGVDRIVFGGASLGAVASWHAAWMHPGTVDGLVLQSGTFALSRHAEIPPPMATSLRGFLDDAWADGRLAGVRVGQMCGRYESLIDWNRQVADRIATAAAAHTYTEAWTGHDWGAWADTFVGCLATALGPDGGLSP